MRTLRKIPMVQKAVRRKRNGSRNRNRVAEVYNIENGKPMDISGYAKPEQKKLIAKNQEQSTYINSLKNHTVTVCLGSIGSGKTFIPSVLAGNALTDKSSGIKKVILIRPNEPLGKSLGMLPGDLKEKLKPWLAPIADGVQYAVGKGFYEYAVESEKVEYLAVEHVRGRTFNDAYVIVDEAQNLSVEAMVAILTRIGENCKMAICGDIAQKDIKGESGLGMLKKLSEDYDYLPYNIVELTECVRSKEAAAFLSVFQQEGLL